MAGLPLDSLRTLLPLFLGALAVALAMIKIGVVLAVLRRGLGGGVPPASVLTLLALLLATLAMMPTIERSQQAVTDLPVTATPAELLQAGGSPLREFLQRHTAARDQQVVLDLAARLAPATGDKADASRSDATAPIAQNTSLLPVPLTVLAPAFALSELRAAFLLGFGLLLPLLLIDLLCAVLLSGVELHGLSPRAVALPFKLLLFVVGNGWQLVLRGLLLGYA